MHARSETDKEVKWIQAYHKARLSKLKDKFYEVLDYEKFSVKSMRTSSYVTSFRVPTMSEFLKKNIEQFKAMMEKELNSKGDDYEEDEEQEENAAELTLNQTTKKTVASVSTHHKSEGEKKREERKIQREVRKKQIDKLLKKEHMP